MSEAPHDRVVDGPSMAMFLAMFGTMATLMVGSIWSQHRDSRTTREEATRQIERATAENTRQIERATAENTRQIERATAENTRQIERATDRLSSEFAEHKQITDKNHRSTQQQLGRIADSLGDARERLARIEGHLQIGSAPPDDTKASNESSDAA